MSLSLLHSTRINLTNTKNRGGDQFPIIRLALEKLQTTFFFATF